VFETAKGLLVTLTVVSLAPGFQISEARQVVVELTDEELSVGVANKTYIETFFRNIDADDPQMVLILG
jgi:hypothetical protein